MVRLAAPDGPRETEVVLQGGREARPVPPPSAAEAAELLSGFFDARRRGADDEDDREGGKRSASSAAMTSDVARSGERPLENGRGRGVFGTRLLPARYSATGVRGLSDARMWMVAASPVNVPLYGPEMPEDPRYRALITQATPPVLLLELNAQATFNMMDPDLSLDTIFAMESCLEIIKNPKEFKHSPVSYVIQGSGPHFCPGGNPKFQWYEGHTAMSTAQYTGYYGFVKCREFGIPGVAALHGSMVGGGVAYCLNCTQRIGATTLSVAYGNVSRGAVPGMLLSKNVTETLGLTGAIQLYLSDTTLSSYACIKGGFITNIVPGNAQIKAEGVRIARRIGANPLSTVVAPIKPAMDMSRYSSEAIGIILGGLSGELFASLNEVRKKKTEQPRIEEGQGEEQQWQEEWQAKPRPKRRPKRRPRRE